MTSSTSISQSQMQTRKGVALPLLLLALFFGILLGILKHRFLNSGSNHALVGAQFIRLIPLAFLAFAVFLKLVGRYWRQTFGTIRYLQVSSISAEERIRQRYGAEMNELAGLGFDQLFTFGEGFSVFRVFLVFPAMTVVSMLLKRENLSIEHGSFVMSYPVLVARNKSAFAHIFAMGTKFYTAFEDGTFLISKNFVSDLGERPGVVEYARAASIADTWAEHQRRIQTLEAGGKRINRQTSFEFYSELTRRDRPAS